MKRVIFLIGAVAALLLVVPGFAEDDRPTEIPYATPGEIPELNPGYKMTTHRVVLITDQALNPRLVTLTEGQLVAWNSYSSAESVVVFEREVARSMICHSLVNFSIENEEIRSAEINAGEFASFCELKPGRYRYKVVRSEAHKTAVNAATKLEGEIVVKGKGL